MVKTMETKRALYIDLELTCWDGPVPPGMRSEIIQIGLVEVNLFELKITRRESWLIRPQNSTISEFCTSLTGITPADVKKKGRRFPDTMRTFMNRYGYRNKPSFAWGSDQDALNDACEGIACPIRLVDLGLQFRMEMGLPQAPSLEAALNMVGLKFEGRPHDALVDAENTARLHMELIRTRRAAYKSPAVVYVPQVFPVPDSYLEPRPIPTEFTVSC